MSSLKVIVPLLAVFLGAVVGCDSSSTPSRPSLAPDTRTTPAGLQLVSPDNFVRAESDLFFGNMVKDGGLGKVHHNRDVAPVDKQLVVRLNRDTLYTSGVFDLDAGPVTIGLPDAGDRFMSMQVINQDQYTPNVFYGKGEHTLTRENIGTRYVAVAIRTLVDAQNPADLSAARAVQDGITVEQDRVGTFEVPKWDPVSQKQVRDALLQLWATLPDTRQMFGTKAEVDPVRRLIGAAGGWGGNPDKDALYLTVTPPRNDGTTVHRLTVRNVPVEGFWSVSVYNKDGYFEPNPQNAYAVNNLTATKSPDGATTIQFGGCGNGVANCLPITPGWNYTVRLYRPSTQILDGSWTFPEPVAVG